MLVIYFFLLTSAFHLSSRNQIFTIKEGEMNHHQAGLLLWLQLRRWKGFRHLVYRLRLSRIAVARLIREETRPFCREPFILVSQLSYTP